MTGASPGNGAGGSNLPFVAHSGSAACGLTAPLGLTAPPVLAETFGSAVTLGLDASFDLFAEVCPAASDIASAAADTRTIANDLLSRSRGFDIGELLISLRQVN